MQYCVYNNSRDPLGKKVTPQKPRNDIFKKPTSKSNSVRKLHPEGVMETSYPDHKFRHGYDKTAPTSNDTFQYDLSFKKREAHRLPKHEAQGARRRRTHHGLL